MMPPTASLRDLIDRYDLFLLDQFGVLHDGGAAYPGAIEALDTLREAGKRIVLVSNSGKRAAANEKRLERLGFSAKQWDRFVSSGEVAWEMLSGTAGRFGCRCLLLSRDGDHSPIEGLGIELVADAREADFILLAGSRGDELPFSHYSSLLSPAVEAGTPCLCINPDKVMLTPDGAAYGAGSIAEFYAKAGGTVTWIGKPYPEIYASAVRGLADSKASIVALGDSVEHDIAGARQFGIASALVRSGIHRGANADELEGLFRKHDARPHCILDSFRAS
jgi:HAD superfamily hydrolase (TIGR01459 family)